MSAALIMIAIAVATRARCRRARRIAGVVGTIGDDFQRHGDHQLGGGRGELDGCENEKRNQIKQTQTHT